MFISSFSRIPLLIFTFFWKLLKTRFSFFKQFHCQFVLTHKANEFWFNNSTQKIPVPPNSKIRFNYFLNEVSQIREKAGTANSKFSPQNRRKNSFAWKQKPCEERRQHKFSFLFLFLFYFIFSKPWRPVKAKTNVKQNTQRQNSFNFHIIISVLFCPIIILFYDYFIFFRLNRKYFCSSVDGKNVISVCNN